MNYDLGIGLAGGIDKDGSRAGELLAAGFASVEFGSVAAGDREFPDASAVNLATALAAWRAACPVDCPPPAARVGVGIGRPAGTPAARLPEYWLAGFDAVAAVADYVSCNLSAAANRPLLAAECWPLLAQALVTVAGRRDALAAAGGRRLALALKLPLAGDELPLAVARMAAVAGFDRLTLVRPDGDAGFARLAALAAHLAALGDVPVLVAVGGIRNAADVAAARAAGAAGVQVHRAFADHGAACLAALRGALSIS